MFGYPFGHRRLPEVQAEDWIAHEPMGAVWLNPVTGHGLACENSPPDPHMIFVAADPTHIGQREDFARCGDCGPGHFQRARSIAPVRDAAPLLSAKSSTKR